MKDDPRSQLPVLAGERKPATILLVNFLSPTGSPNPGPLAGIIAKYDGTITQRQGDKLMALFGVPRVRENDAERAIRAALEMRQARADADAGFVIDTGLVVSGAVAGERQEYSVAGGPVNFVAKMAQAATPGQILVGRETHRLTAALFNFGAPAPVRVKSRSSRLLAYQVLGPKAAADVPSVRQPRISSPLVGREAEFARICDGIERLFQGQGGVVSIVGILAFYDESMANGTLAGSGPGSSAKGRAKALRNMIEAAGDLLAAGDVETACDQLKDAYARTDGQPNPPDFVAGPAVPELASMIEELRTWLNCD